MTEQAKKLLFSSNSDQWETPQDFFDELDREFRFSLDPCADDQNHKCDKYFTVEQDGLSQNWGGNVCSAIRHTARISPNGSGRPTRKVLNRTLSWSC